MSDDLSNRGNLVGLYFLVVHIVRHVNRDSREIEHGHIVGYVGDNQYLVRPGGSNHMSIRHFDDLVRFSPRFFSTEMALLEAIREVHSEDKTNAP